MIGTLVKPVKSLLFFVIFPTFVVFSYLAFFHSPMYESETVFAIRSTSDMGQSFDFASQIFKKNNASIQDAQIVNAYVESVDAFDQLDKKLNLISHYTDRRKDPYSRLSSKPTQDEKRRFWEHITTLMLDTDSGILTFRVRSYTPKMAYSITQEILTETERLVNSMNARAQVDTLSLAEDEIVSAQKQLASSQDALRNFRDAQKDIDLKSTITGLHSVVIGLEEERVKTSAQLAEAASYMKPNAPMRKALKARLSALNAQIQNQKARLSDSKESGNLNSQISKYEILTMNHEFAQKRVTEALRAWENARISMLSKTRYMVPITKPTMPDESLYPKPFQFATIFGVVLLLLYGLLLLIIASIREHMGF